MPLRVYHARRSPPSRLDHVLAHPWEVGVSIFQSLGGLLGILGVFLPDLTISANGAIDQMPRTLAGGMCLFLLVGGLATLAGLFDEHDNLMVGYRRERIGLFLGSTAWLVYALVVVASFPWSVLGWSFGFFLGGCGLVRVWATYREEDRLRQGTHPPTPDPDSEHPA